MIRPAILAIGIAVSGTSYALTGNDLVSMCSDRANMADENICLGYLNGFTDGYNMGRPHWMFELAALGARVTPYGEKDRLIVPGADYCIPQGVTVGQLKNVVSAWLRANPAKTHEQAAGLVLQAISRAFPCPAK